MKTKSILLTAVATIGLTAASMAQVPNYVPTNGLVGWWPFNGNANDESGNGNNGTVNGATLTADRFGNVNKAYSFDGITNNIITSFAFPTGNQPKSVSLWYTTNDVNDRAWIISNNLACNEINSQDKGFGLFMDGDSNNGGSSETPTLIFHGSGPISDMYFLNTNFTASNWYHIAVTYDGSSLKSFVNGALNNNIIISLNTIDNSVLFGSRTTQYVNGCPEEYHDGNIDDIGIWNRALSQQEITDLYNSTNCSNDLTISPSINSLQIGSTANFTATTSDANASVVWQSDLGQGFQTLNDIGNYSGTSSNTLSISNVQLSEQNQQVRAIATSSNCTDTSNVASIQIVDTCISNVTVYDTLTTNITIYDTLITNIYYTLLTTVTDTLIINTTLSLPAPNNENTILIYPNPASDHITIDNGNYAAMAGYSIKIENNAGQQVFQSAINQAQFYIDITTWSGNGLYFVHLIDSQNNTVTIRKIMLQ